MIAENDKPPFSNGAGDPGVLSPFVCVKDNVEVNNENPRCRHPSSRCMYRELCDVIAAGRAAAKARETRDG